MKRSPVFVVAGIVLWVLTGASFSWAQPTVLCKGRSSCPWVPRHPHPGGWQAVATGGNQVHIGPEEICIQSMKHRTGFATQPRFYDFEEEYGVEFDFRLQEKNNHWFILFSDSFVHLHIDWGTDLFFMGPRNTKITNLDVGRWYHIRIDARPSDKSYSISIDGRQAASGSDITPGRWMWKKILAPAALMAKSASGFISVMTREQAMTGVKPVGGI